MEFSSVVHDGKINLPVELRNLFEDEPVKIVLTLEKKTQFSGNKQKLKSAFLKLQKVGLFDDIESPVKWQRSLRDEWEQNSLRFKCHYFNFKE